MRGAFVGARPEEIFPLISNILAIARNISDMVLLIILLKLFDPETIKNSQGEKIEIRHLEKIPVDYQIEKHMLGNAYT